MELSPSWPPRPPEEAIAKYWAEPNVLETFVCDVCDVAGVVVAWPTRSSKERVHWFPGCYCLAPELFDPGAYHLDCHAFEEIDRQLEAARNPWPMKAGLWTSF